MKEGWKYLPLGDICDFISGYTPKKDELNSECGIPYYKVSDMNRETNTLYLTETELYVKAPKKTIPANSIVFPKNGGAIFTGKKRILKYDSIVDLNTEAIKIKSDKVLLPYLFQYLQLIDFGLFDNGGGLPSINIKKMKTHIIPIPSLPEQQRIVSYLDTEFAKIEALKANAEKQLQAAKDLFQAALKEMLTPKEGWVEKKLGELCSICGEYGLNESATDYNGVRYLRITDITDDGELNNDKVSAQNKGKKNQEELEVGDILFARTGATVGKTLVYRKEFGKCVFAGYLIRYRTNPNIILPQYLFYYTHSTKYYDWVRNNQAAAAQPNISAQKYNCLIIAFPKDTAEQQRIANRLDALSANVKALQTNYTETITLCNDLKQALLKKVFE